MRRSTLPHSARCSGCGRVRRHQHHHSSGHRGGYKLGSARGTTCSSASSSHPSRTSQRLNPHARCAGRQRWYQPPIPPAGPSTHVPAATACCSALQSQRAAGISGEPMGCRGSVPGGGPQRSHARPVDGSLCKSRATEVRDSVPVQHLSRSQQQSGGWCTVMG